MEFSGDVLFKVGLGIIAIVAGYDRWHGNIRMTGFPVATFPADTKGKSRAKQISD